MSQVHSVQSAWQTELAPGARVEFEAGLPPRIWGLAEQAVGHVELWMKSVGGLVDFRVCIRRTSDGLRVSLDRGEDHSGNWWSPEAAPGLILQFRPDGTVVVEAAIDNLTHTLGTMKPRR